MTELSHETLAAVEGDCMTCRAAMLYQRDYLGNREQRAHVDTAAERSTQDEEP